MVCYHVGAACENLMKNQSQKLSFLGLWKNTSHVCCKVYSEVVVCHYLYSVELGGGMLERPHPGNEKNCCKNYCCYLSGVYTFWEGAELQGIFSKKLWKKSILHWNFDQEISKCAWNLSIFHLWFKRPGFCTQLLNFPCQMEIIRQILMIFHFLQIPRFSPKNSRIFIPFPIVLVYLGHFCLLW